MGESHWIRLTLVLLSVVVGGLTQKDYYYRPTIRRVSSTSTALPINGRQRNNDIGQISSHSGDGQYRPASDDGQYHPTNEGQYIPDNSGAYMRGEEGRYYPTNEGRYATDDSGQYHPSDDESRFIGDLKNYKSTLPKLNYTHDGGGRNYQSGSRFGAYFKTPFPGGPVNGKSESIKGAGTASYVTGRGTFGNGQLRQPSRLTNAFEKTPSSFAKPVLTSTQYRGQTNNIENSRLSFGSVVTNLRQPNSALQKTASAFDKITFGTSKGTSTVANNRPQSPYGFANSKLTPAKLEITKPANIPQRVSTLDRPRLTSGGFNNRTQTATFNNVGQAKGIISSPLVSSNANLKQTSSATGLQLESNRLTNAFQNYPLAFDKQVSKTSLSSYEPFGVSSNLPGAISRDPLTNSQQIATTTLGSNERASNYQNHHFAFNKPTSTSGHISTKGSVTSNQGFGTTSIKGSSTLFGSPEFQPNKPTNAFQAYSPGLGSQAGRIDSKLSTSFNSNSPTFESVNIHSGSKISQTYNKYPTDSQKTGFSTFGSVGSKHTHLQANISPSNHNVPFSSITGSKTSVKAPIGSTSVSYQYPKFESNSFSETSKVSPNKPATGYDSFGQTNKSALSFQDTSTRPSAFSQTGRFDQANQNKPFSKVNAPYTASKPYQLDQKLSPFATAYGSNKNSGPSVFSVTPRPQSSTENVLPVSSPYPAFSVNPEIRGSLTLSTIQLSGEPGPKLPDKSQSTGNYNLFEHSKHVTTEGAPPNNFTAFLKESGIDVPNRLPSFASISNSASVGGFSRSYPGESSTASPFKSSTGSSIRFTESKPNSLAPSVSSKTKITSGTDSYQNFNNKAQISANLPLRTGSQIATSSLSQESVKEGFHSRRPSFVASNHGRLSHFDANLNTFGAQLFSPLRAEGTVPQFGSHSRDSSLQKVSNANIGQQYGQISTSGVTNAPGVVSTDSSGSKTVPSFYAATGLPTVSPNPAQEGQVSKISSQFGFARNPAVSNFGNHDNKVTQTGVTTGFGLGKEPHAGQKASKGSSPTQFGFSKTSTIGNNEKASQGVFSSGFDTTGGLQNQPLVGRKDPKELFSSQFGFPRTPTIGNNNKAPQSAFIAGHGSTNGLHNQPPTGQRNSKESSSFQFGFANTPTIGNSNKDTFTPGFGSTSQTDSIETSPQFGFSKTSTIGNTNRVPQGVLLAGSGITSGVENQAYVGQKDTKVSSSSQFGFLKTPTFGNNNKGTFTSSFGSTSGLQNQPTAGQKDSKDTSSQFRFSKTTIGKTNKVPQGVFIAGSGTTSRLQNQPTAGQFSTSSSTKSEFSKTAVVSSFDNNNKVPQAGPSSGFGFTSELQNQPFVAQTSAGKNTQQSTSSAQFSNIPVVSNFDNKNKVPQPVFTTSSLGSGLQNQPFGTQINSGRGIQQISRIPLGASGLSNGLGLSKTPTVSNFAISKIPQSVFTPSLGITSGLENGKEVLQTSKVPSGISGTSPQFSKAPTISSFENSYKVPQSGLSSSVSSTTGLEKPLSVPTDSSRTGRVHSSVFTPTIGAIVQGSMDTGLPGLQNFDSSRPSNAFGSKTGTGGRNQDQYRPSNQNKPYNTENTGRQSEQGTEQHTGKYTYESSGSSQYKHDNIGGYIHNERKYQHEGGGQYSHDSSGKYSHDDKGYQHQGDDYKHVSSGGGGYKNDGQGYSNTPDGSGRYVHDDKGYNHQDSGYKHVSPGGGQYNPNGQGYLHVPDGSEKYVHDDQKYKHVDVGGGGYKHQKEPTDRYKQDPSRGDFYTPGNNNNGYNPNGDSYGGGKLDKNLGGGPLGIQEPAQKKSTSDICSWEALQNYKIIRQKGELDQDKYHYLYETENCMYGEERGELNNKGADDEVMRAEGIFYYVGPDKVKYTVTYTADENGFVPHGDHIPTPPPVPAAILRSLEYKKSIGEI